MHKRLILIGIIILMAGCNTTPQQITPFPDLSDQSKAAQITVIRSDLFYDSDVVLVFTINGNQIYTFKSGERIEFQLDPGEYIFGVGDAMADDSSYYWKEIQVEVGPLDKHIYRIFTTSHIDGDVRIQRLSEK